MSKRIKMCLYGEPGVGKSVFASKFPKPFFITTDGNYEWLIDFGANEEDHINVRSWSEAKKAFQMDFSKYETIVVDLTEDLFKWCEQEFCKRNGYEHISDLGFGKGYDITRNDFVNECSKLINLDKHVLFIMHGKTSSEKDRRGIEHVIYRPTDRIPDKVLDTIEGKVRYFLRCYVIGEEQSDGKIIKKRYLSIVPKETEKFAIARGIDENVIPHDIPLEYNDFAEAIGLIDSSNKKQVKAEKIDTIKIVKTIENVETKQQVTEPKVELKLEPDDKLKTELRIEPKVDSNVETELEEIVENEDSSKPVVTENKTEVKQTEVENKPHVETNEEKMARIMAKLRGNK